MDIVRLKELCTLAETRVAQAVEYIRTNQKVDVEWNLITSPIYESIEQVNTLTNIRADVNEQARVVIDSGISPLEGARRCAMRYHSLAPYLVRLLEIYDEKKSTSVTEAVNALTTFRDRIQELMDCYLQLREYWRIWKLDFEEPPAPWTPTVSEPAYVSRIEAKLDKILEKISAGTQPITQPTSYEGVVGAHKEVLDWRAPALSEYGSPGRPAKRLSNYQTDILFTQGPKATGKGRTVSRPASVWTHLTDQGTEFWLSVATVELPKQGTYEITLSDLDAAGARIIQKLTV